MALQTNQYDFLLAPVAVNNGLRAGSTQSVGVHQSDFDNIWTYNPAECDFINHYTDVDLQHENNGHSDLSLAELNAQDLGLLDESLVMKCEHDEMASSDHDVIMAPDSQTHVSTSAQSPYTDINQMSPLSLHKYSSSSPTVPSSTSYSGDYGFGVSVQKQPKETKSATWTHSEKLSKLYARIGVAIPFVYRCGAAGARSWSMNSAMPSSAGTLHPPPGTVIRILPVYIRPEHVRDVVRRCPNHAAEAVNTGSRLAASKQAQTMAEAQHLIKSQHSKARYLEDACSHRLSVVIPYEQPQAGAEWVTTLLEFHCFSSCVGGLNRRPVQLIFTLESTDGTVLGRQAIEVRVCACPGRDRAGDERSALGSSSSSSGGPSDSGSTSQSGGALCGRGVNEVESRRGPGGGGGSRSGGAAKRTAAAATIAESSMDLFSKRPRDEVDGDVFSLKIRGRRNFELLSTLRDCLELSSLLPPQLADQYRAKQIELGQRLTAFDQSPAGMTSSVKSGKSKSPVAPTDLSSTTLRSSLVPASASSMVYQVGAQLFNGDSTIFYHQ